MHGLGMLPEKAFSTRPYYAVWMDTSESQKLLGLPALFLFRFRSRDASDGGIEEIQGDAAATALPPQAAGAVPVS